MLPLRLGEALRSGESAGLREAALGVRRSLLRSLLSREGLLVVLGLLLLEAATLATLGGVLVARRSSSLTLLALVVAAAAATVALLVVLTALLGLLLQLRGTGNGTGNVLGSVVDVQALVDVLRNGLDLSAKLLLNSVQVEAVLPIDQVDSQTKVTETAGTTDTVEVGLGVLGEIEVDDNVYSLNIDTTSEEIGTDEVTAVASAEVVEDAVTVLLKHAGVRVEAGVAELSNLLGQKLDTGGRVTEDDGLVDLETGEKGVETVDLLLLLDEGIVLGNTA